MKVGIFENGSTKNVIGKIGDRNLGFEKRPTGLTFRGTRDERSLVGVAHRRIENGLKNPASQNKPHLCVTMLFAPSGRSI